MGGTVFPSLRVGTVIRGEEKKEDQPRSGTASRSASRKKGRESFVSCSRGGRKGTFLSKTGRFKKGRRYLGAEKRGPVASESERERAWRRGEKVFFLSGKMISMGEKCVDIT